MCLDVFGIGIDPLVYPSKKGICGAIMAGRVAYEKKKETIRNVIVVFKF